MASKYRPTTAEEKALYTGPGKLSPDQYKALVAKAIQMDLDECTPPMEGEKFSQKCKEYIVVPKVSECSVPITREIMKPGFKTHTIKGTRLVPQHKTRTETENVIEVKEEIVKCKRIVWKPCEEEYYETIKKPVECTRTKTVPYTEYCEEEVEMTVEVPCDTLVYEKGSRIDKKLTSEVIEVEKEMKYKMVPTLCDDGEVITTKAGGMGRDFGRIEVGHEVYDGCEMPYPAPAGTKEYATGLVIPEELETDYPEVNAFVSSERPGTQRSQLSTSGGRLSTAGRPKTGQSVHLGQAYSRPPTGALIQDPRSGKMMQVPSGGVHPSVAALMMPSQNRLQTPGGMSTASNSLKPNMKGGRPGSRDGRGAPSWR